MRTRLLTLLAGAVLIVSCSKTDNDALPYHEESIEEKIEHMNVEIISDEILSAEEMAEAVFGEKSSNQLIAGNEELKEELHKAFIKKHLEQKPNGQLEGIATGWRSINYKYETIDEKHYTVKLSARVYWGVFNFIFGDVALDPDYIVLCPHYTITANSQCPTNCHTYEAAALVGDNLIIMPDYEGLGSSNGIQPYINHDINARQCMDALAAGYKVFKQMSGAEMEDDWKLYLTGASQGGGNALAVHKYLDTHPSEAEFWKFDYSYCCAGPHNPVLTFNKYFENKKHTYPVVFPLTIKSMISAHSSLFSQILSKYREEDFFTEDYVTNLKAEIDRMISSRDYKAGEINKKFFEHYPHKGEEGIDGGKEIYLSDIVHPDVMNPDTEIHKDLMKCLEESNLTTGWAPSHLIKLYHGEDDEIVPFENSLSVVKAFPYHTELFNSGWGTGGHEATILKWIITLATNNW